MEVAFLRLLLPLISYVLARGETGTIKSTSDFLPTNKPPASKSVDGSSVTLLTKSHDVRDLLGRTFNLSTYVDVTDTVQLTLANKKIDLSAFTVDESNATPLQNMLEEHSLSDIMYIATKMARIEKKIVEKFIRTLEFLPLEAIFDPNDDLELTREDVDELEREIIQRGRSTRCRRKALAGKHWSTTIPAIMEAICFSP